MPYVPNESTLRLGVPIPSRCGRLTSGITDGKDGAADVWTHAGGIEAGPAEPAAAARISVPTAQAIATTASGARRAA
jgi:hypothetical protein